MGGAFADSAGIVYLLPSSVSSLFWKETYGSRIYFYVKEDIAPYAAAIRDDFRVIAEQYPFIVMILPCDDGTLFYRNLRLLNGLAMEAGLKILFAFFPKNKYGPESDYLQPGTRMNLLVLDNMAFVLALPAAQAVAVWYGWKVLPFSIAQIAAFAESLPLETQARYCIWLDQPYIASAVTAGLPKMGDELGITVATEIYSSQMIPEYSSKFRRQILVTGYNKPTGISDWIRGIRRKLALVTANADASPRTLVIWTFWDKNDGSGEFYGAYLEGKLANPLK